MQRGRFIHLIVLSGSLTLIGWSSRHGLAAVPAVEKKGLPAGYDAHPIGSDDTLKDRQSVSVDNGVWTIQAGGSGLGSEADGGLGIYSKHTGNGSISAHLTTEADPDAQVAVVFRQTTDPGARMVRLTFSNRSLLQPEVRRIADDTPATPGTGDNSQVGILGFSGKATGTIPAAGRPLGNGIWLGIDRNGDIFGLYFSNDGKIWTQVAGVSSSGDSQFPADMLIGVEVSSHNSGKLTTAKLDNVIASNELLAPRAITGIFSLPQDKAVIVTWNPVSTVDAPRIAATASDVTYNVYQFTRADTSDAQKVNKDPIKTSSFMVPGLTNGTAYRFGVTGVLNGVESPLALPLPTMGQRSIGLVVPNPPIQVAGLNGFQVYTVGTQTPGEVIVTGTGPDARIRMRAGGWDFWEAGDGFAYLALPMEGDVDVSVRLVRGPAGVDSGGGWEQGGPQIRKTLDAGSIFAMAEFSRANGMEFKRRRIPFQRPTSTGAHLDDDTARPLWTRLVMKGDTVQAFYSTDDGKTWQGMGNPTSNSLTETSKDTVAGLGGTHYVGIALTAHSEGRITEADLDHFVIKSPF